MIRIDEIYNHTFWPYIKNNLPKTRMFFCDPPGSTSPETLFNFGEDYEEHNFIYCHDQEPLHLDVHRSLFEELFQRNLDLNYNTGPLNSAIIVSELESDSVHAVCRQYSWESYYYFFHGWAALDWYRGYHRTFLIAPPQDRSIKYSFISPNRIIGGRRDHRVLLMYHMLKNNVSNALISFPKTCPQENTTTEDIAKKYSKDYPDIESTMAAAAFPWNMPGESGHPMHSCWLSLFEQNSQCLLQVVTETSYFGRKWHLTEKIFKPICLQMPFVLISNAGSLEYLQSYGFQTFGNFWDESYDQEIDDLFRLEKISKLLTQFDSMSPKELTQLYRACLPVIQHNYEHFYNGNFEHILWNEFKHMLERLTLDFKK